MFRTTWSARKKMLVLAYIKSFFNEYNNSCHCHPNYVTKYLESEIIPLFSKDQEVLAKKMAEIKFKYKTQDVEFIFVDKDNLDHLEYSIKNVDYLQHHCSLGYIDSYDSEYSLDHLDPLFEIYNKELTVLKEKEKQAEQKHLQEVAAQKAKQDEINKQQKLKEKKEQLEKLAKELGVEIDTTKT